MSEDRIEAEVVWATERCAKSGALLIYAAEVMLRLRKQDWPDEDAVEVGRRVLRSIKAGRTTSND